jgi:hypothetical protein
MRSSVPRPAESQPPVACSMVMARIEWMLYGENPVRSLKPRPLVTRRRTVPASRIGISAVQVARSD